jgi:hypothetical protein
MEQTRLIDELLIYLTILVGLFVVCVVFAEILSLVTNHALLQTGALPDNDIFMIGLVILVGIPILVTGLHGPGDGDEASKFTDVKGAERK